MANELEILGYDWEDIVGETTRGMSPAAHGSPAAMRKRPLTKTRQLTLGLGQTYIGVNATKNITVNPQCFFRAEKLIATDNCTLLGGAGFGTQITAVSIGNKNQLPVGAGAGAIPTFTYDKASLGNGVEWDTCQPALSITISVQDLGVTAGGSTWSGALFGKTVMS